MGDMLATEEDQIPFQQLLSRHTVREGVMLLVGIPRKYISTHAIAKLDKATTINASPACSTPEIRNAEEGTSIGSDHRNRCPWILCSSLTNSHTLTRQPSDSSTWETHLNALVICYVKYWQDSGKINGDQRFL